MPRATIPAEASLDERDDPFDPSAEVLETLVGAELEAELVKHDQKSATTEKEIEKKEKERRIIQQVHDNFMDPQRVFGDSERNKKTGVLQAELKGSDVPVMQYLERGFLRDDGTKYDKPGSAKEPREIFNADAVAVLARYGFNPGSKFGDTMHFDFVEGYNDLIVGGRKAAENMRMNRASPENGLPPSVNGGPVNPLPPVLKTPSSPESPLSLPREPVPPIWQVPLLSQ